MIPRPRSFVMMSLALRSIFSDNSLMVTPSVIVISFRISGTWGGRGGGAGRATGGGTACGLVAWAVAAAVTDEGGKPARRGASPRAAGRRGAVDDPDRGGIAGLVPAGAAGERD